MAGSITHSVVHAPNDQLPAADWNAGHTIAGMIHADGTTDFTADQSMGGFVLTQLGAGVAPTDAVQMQQVILADGSAPLTADWDVGNNGIYNLDFVWLYDNNCVRFGNTPDANICYDGNSLIIDSDMAGGNGAILTLTTAGGSTVTANGDHIVVLGDAAGANTFRLWDNTLNPVFTMDSTGVAQFFNDIVLPNDAGEIYDAGNLVYQPRYSGQVWDVGATTGVGYSFAGNSVTSGAVLAAQGTSITSGYVIGASIDGATATSGSLYRGFSGPAANIPVFDVDHDGIIWGWTQNSNARFRRLQHKGVPEMFFDGGSTPIIPFMTGPEIFWPLSNTTDSVYFQFHLPQDWDGTSDIDVIVRVCLLGNEDAGDRISSYLAVTGKKHCDTLDGVYHSYADDTNITTNNQQYHVFDLFFSLVPTMMNANLERTDTIFCRFGLPNLTTPYIDYGVGVISARMWYHTSEAATQGTLA